MRKFTSVGDEANQILQWDLGNECCQMLVKTEFMLTEQMMLMPFTGACAFQGKIVGCVPCFWSADTELNIAPLLTA